MRFAKTLRIITTILLSLAAAMTLLGGIGTSCVAFAAENFGPAMAPLIPVKPIFQVLVVASLLAGIVGVVGIVRLVRRSPGAVWWVLGFLGVGLVTSGIQYWYSLTLRGSTAPNDMRLYLTAIALVWLLVMLIPGVWRRTGFGETSTTRSGMGAPVRLAMVAAGALIATTPWWAAPTHYVDGVNTAQVLFWPLVVTGVALVAYGAVGWNLLPVIRSYASTYRARVAATTSAGSGGGGSSEALFQPES